MTEQIDLEQAKELAVKLAKEAGDTVLASFGKQVEAHMKNDHSFVTEMDKKIQKFIIAAITEKYPNHSFVGEESDVNTVKSDYVWYVDPIDGTHNYMRGNEIFGVMIGLAHKGESVVGVVNMPKLGYLCSAVKGNGTFINGEKVNVSNITDSKKGMIVTQLWFRDKNPKKMDLINKLHGVVNSGRDFGSAAHDFVAIARGALDGHVISQTHPWDLVPGIVIVKEAGGKATTFTGEEIVVGTEDLDIIISNGKIHNQLIEALK